MSSRTEMESRMVILKPSFSPLVWLMKKEARSRTRNKTIPGLELHVLTLRISQLEDLG